MAAQITNKEKEDNKYLDKGGHFYIEISSPAF